MKRCKIALTISTDDPNYCIRQRYTKVLLCCAAQADHPIMPVILPLTEDETLIRAYAGEFDGFLFTGGDDVDPARYGEERLPQCGIVEPERDAFEFSLLREITVLQKPVFGICRGMQVMNVFCGGSLWQDMPTQYEVPDGQKHCEKNKNGVPRHDILADGWLARTTGKTRFSANSYHHQSVKIPGRDLTVCGRSNDGTVEAFVHDTLPFYCAVQWHPDVEPDEISQKLLEAFFNAASETRNQR